MHLHRMFLPLGYTHLQVQLAVKQFLLIIQSHFTDSLIHPASYADSEAAFLNQPIFD